MEAAAAEVRLAIKPDELVRVLRVIAKHANACADELAGAAPFIDDDEPAGTEAVDIDAVKRERAERHKRLGGATS